VSHIVNLMLGLQQPHLSNDSISIFRVRKSALFHSPTSTAH